MALLRSKDKLISDYNFELDYQRLNRIYFDYEDNTDLYRDRLTLTEKGYVYNGSLGTRNNIISLYISGVTLYEVKYTYVCGYNDNLTSLQGAPRIVGLDFYCPYCENLKTLEGAPEKVGGIFDCGDCENLESLVGAPVEVGGRFICGACPKLKK